MSKSIDRLEQWEAERAEEEAQRRKEMAAFIDAKQPGLLDELGIER